MTKCDAILRRGLQRPQAFVCWRCQQARSITQNFLKKKEEGRVQWEEFATEIRCKKRKSMLSILEERGFVHALAGERHAVDNLMIDKRVGIYVGVDPTAPSLHVGHLLPMMALFWMHLHGFHTITLLGGSTARIGDPTGRTSDRAMMTPTERKANAAAVHYQMKRIWLNVERVGKRHGYEQTVHWKRELVNNAIWWNNLTFLDILKTLGSGLRLGAMLSRDTVKTKMASKDGMSFSEFCYPVMQAWDWWRMYYEKGIQMQIGGSDQYGNIVAGIDAIKYIAKTHPDPDTRQEGGVRPLTTPCGFTVPLLTTASGAKFGKSAGNAIWLDQEKTSVFDLYGFFIRTADADVSRYLRLLTFLPLPEIQSLMDQHMNDPSKRIPHHRLAHEIVDFIHGEAAAKKAESEHRALFQNSNSAKSMPSTAQEENKATTPNPYQTNQNEEKRKQGSYVSSVLNKYAPQANSNSGAVQGMILPKSLIYNQPIARVLHAAGLVTSRSEGHRLAEAQGAYIGRRSSNREQMSDDLSFVPAKLADPMQTWSNVIRDDEVGDTMEKAGEEGLLILRVGKWKVKVIRVVSDDKFKEMGIEGPAGWRELLAQDAVSREHELLNDMPKNHNKTMTKRGGEWKEWKDQHAKGKEVMDKRRGLSIDRNGFPMEVNESSHDNAPSEAAPSTDSGPPPSELLVISPTTPVTTAPGKSTFAHFLEELAAKRLAQNPTLNHGEALHRESTKVLNRQMWPEHPAMKKLSLRSGDNSDGFPDRALKKKKPESDDMRGWRELNNDETITPISALKSAGDTHASDKAGLPRWSLPDVTNKYDESGGATTIHSSISNAAKSTFAISSRERLRLPALNKAAVPKRQGINDAKTSNPEPPSSSTAPTPRPTDPHQKAHEISWVKARAKNPLLTFKDYSRRKKLRTNIYGPAPPVSANHVPRSEVYMPRGKAVDLRGFNRQERKANYAGNRGKSLGW